MLKKIKKYLSDKSRERFYKESDDYYKKGFIQNGCDDGGLSTNGEFLKEGWDKKRDDGFTFKGLVKIILYIILFGCLFVLIIRK